MKDKNAPRKPRKRGLANFNIYTPYKRIVTTQAHGIYLKGWGNRGVEVIAVYNDVDNNSINVKIGIIPELIIAEHTTRDIRLHLCFNKEEFLSKNKRSIYGKYPRYYIVYDYQKQEAQEKGDSNE